MGDIVKHLRIRAQRQTSTGITEPQEHIDWMAADEIDHLREENALLREALEPFADTADFCERMSDIDYEYVSVGNLRAAAAAIREGDKNDPE